MRVLRQQHWQVATRCLLSGERREGLRVRVRAPSDERMKRRVLGAGSTRNHVLASSPLTTGFHHNKATNEKRIRGNKCLRREQVSLNGYNVHRSIGYL